MNGLGDSVVTFGLIMLTMTFLDNCCYAQNPACTSNSRPHPRGLCGVRLARAHSNLCFLLRTKYPYLFDKKRSAPMATSVSAKRDPSIVEQIYSIPLEVLADLDLTNENNWDLLFAPGGIVDDYQSKQSWDATDDWKLDGAKRARYNDITSMLMEMLKPGRAKREALNSNMVCECCYNRCTPRQLGAYC